MDENLYDLNNFELQTSDRSKGLLGKGRAASVYLALNNLDQQQYAIKVINVLPDKKSRHRILAIKREIDIHLNLNHPLIVAFYSFHYEDNKVFLILEHAQGGNLLEFLGPSPWRVAVQKRVDVFIKVCEIVAYVHQKRIAYRGVSPENVLLTKTGQVRLCDFGNSIRLGAQEIFRAWQGDPLFAAPEVFRGDARRKSVDIWALGVLLHFLLTENYPFITKAEAEALKANSGKQKLNRAHWAYQRLAKGGCEIGKDLPPGARDLLARILKFEPESRLGIEGILQHEFIKQKRLEMFQSKYHMKNSIEELPENEEITRQNSKSNCFVDQSFRWLDKTSHIQIQDANVLKFINKKSQHTLGVNQKQKKFLSQKIEAGAGGSGKKSRSMQKSLKGERCVGVGHQRGRCRNC